MEDLGLQAILEKMNSLITPLVKGPFWNISKFFQKFWRILTSSSQEKNQWTLNLVEPEDIPVLCECAATL